MSYTSERGLEAVTKHLEEPLWRDILDSWSGEQPQE